MNRTIGICLAGCLIIGFLAVGCSDKQEEADKLQQQMMESPETLTTVDTVTAPIDTTPQPDVSAVPEEEPAVRDLPGEPAGSGYAVQIAACESADYARYLVDTYINRGYEPWVTEIEHDGQTYYRVRVGPFETPEAANQMKLELEDRFSIKPWVDPM